MKILLHRWPRNRAELWEWVYTFWGVKIPRVQVCPDHVSPFEAFATAFFAEHPVVIWKASRGFGGKSFLLATLANTEAVILGAESTVLGGSASQSLNVHQHSSNLWGHRFAPRHLLVRAPTRYETWLRNGAHIRALMASQTSVRGPHPQRLRLDEIDEMELAILEAAQGQPMTKNGVLAQTVMSSTHQYPDGTMTAMLERAADKGWPVMTWCWRESMGTDDEPGWLTREDVQRKRSEVAAQFWAVEYDLQEPSFEGRAFDSHEVARMFPLPEIRDTPGKEVVLHPPSGGRYVTGVDWAKERDWTVVWTFDTSTRPWTTVAFLRVNKESWPDMVSMVASRLERYPGVLVHDATGLGNVVSDLLRTSRYQERIDVVLAGRTREIIFNEYVAAVEQGEISCQRIDFPYREHLYCRRQDLFKVGGHPPDSVVAAALAWHVRNRERIVVMPGAVDRPEGFSPYFTDRSIGGSPVGVPLL